MSHVRTEPLSPCSHIQRPCCCHPTISPEVLTQKTLCTVFKKKKKTKKSNTLPEKAVLRMKRNLSRIPLCMTSPRARNHTCKGCSRGPGPHWRHLPAQPFVTCTSETGRTAQEWEAEARDAERSVQRRESQIGCEAAKNRAHMWGAAVRATGETHRGDLTN